jgi:hypothetical protein
VNSSQSRFIRERELDSYWRRISQPKEINYPDKVEKKTLVAQEGKGTSLRQSPIVTCYKWL